MPHTLFEYPRVVSTIGFTPALKHRCDCTQATLVRSVVADGCCVISLPHSRITSPKPQEASYHDTHGGLLRLVAPSSSLTWVRLFHDEPASCSAVDGRDAVSISDVGVGGLSRKLILPCSCELRSTTTSACSTRETSDPS